MNNTTRLPSPIRNYIAAQVEINTSYTNIIDSVEQKYDRTVSRGTITKIKYKFEETKSTNDKPRSGRPRIFTEGQVDEIVQVIEEDRKLTAVDIKRDTYLNSPGASLSTIKNRLAERGLRASSSIPQSIPAEALSECLEFARVYVKTPDIWDKFIFSDESDLFPYKSGKL